MALTKDQRDKLPDSDFAVPGKRALPISDARHVNMAWSQIDRTQGLSESERKTARERILHRAKELGMDTAEWEKLKAMRLEAMSLDLPQVFGHPNRMPFRGVLTRVGVPSDQAPHGSGGKRVMLTHAAAEAALPSLLGMGVDLTNDFDGHNSQAKVGVITAAVIEGDALIIEGFIYAADFPKEALRIQLDQQNLGFSFEAQNIYVESLDADPIVVTACVFTGAAVLMKDKAAYHTTSLAAAAARKREMDEDLKKALASIVGDAVAPIADRLTKLEAGQATINQTIEAQAALVAKVDPVAAKLEAAAAEMETAGVSGFVELRRQATQIRAEAAAGRMPAFAAAAVVAPKVEESAEFKVLKDAVAEIKAAADQAKADGEAALKKAADDLAAANTKLADLQAQAAAAKDAPARKTLPPLVSALVSKGTLTLPDGDDKLTAAAVDKALQGANLPNQTRIQVKGSLFAAGLLQN